MAVNLSESTLGGIDMNYWKNVKDDLDNIYCALQDEESRGLFDARVQYMVDRDGEAYIDAIFELNQLYPKKWRCPELEKVLEDGQGIIIYGCGHDGRMTKRNLEMCGYPIVCWCDGNSELWGSEVEGKRVVSPEELMPGYMECLVIISSKQYETEMRSRLYDVGFPVRNIFSFLYHQGIGVYGKQYFDVFQPGQKEVFIDAGAYNGDTMDEFLKWNGGIYKVYSLELSADMCAVIERKNIPNVQVINCAAWSRNENLFFEDSSRGGNVNSAGTDAVLGRTIDAILDGEEATFIKMDIEGAELEALKGAKETIRKYGPKLAVCIYHKYDDILQLGRYILDLNPDYKFLIRHYTTCMWETVLYAWI